MEKIESIAEAVCNGAKRYQAEQLEALKAFSEIDCGSGMIEGNQKVVSIVDRLLKKIGATIEHIVAPEWGTHVVGRIKPLNAQGKVIINAHLDTVFHAGDAAEHPFHMEGDLAWGLGIADCKGGVVVPTYSIKILQDLGIIPQQEIVMIFNCDEEVGTPSAKEIFEKEIAGAEAVYCFEPTRGNNGIITFRNGWGHAKIQVTGLSSHAFNEYEAGVSATLELANLIQTIYGMNKPEGKFFIMLRPLVGVYPTQSYRIWLRQMLVLQFLIAKPLTLLPVILKRFFQLKRFCPTVKLVSTLKLNHHLSKLMKNQ